MELFVQHRLKVDLQVLLHQQEMFSSMLDFQVMDHQQAHAQIL
jgi:hypothetical protein